MIRWIKWISSGTRPLDCMECNALDRENGRVPTRDKCVACSMPLEISHANQQAWQIWCELDRYGRGVDTMGGFPLGIRLSDLELTCGKHEDPEGLRWRILLIEEHILEERRRTYQRNNAKK